MAEELIENQLEKPDRAAGEPAPEHWSKLEGDGGARLSFAEYGEGIGNASAVLRNNLAAVGLDAPVPTCPGWSTRDLLVHVGVAQRWAIVVLSGGSRSPDVGSLTAGLADYPDPLDWLDAGAVGVLNALVKADAGGDYFFFLKNAPADKREAWARRQCHEATIHAVDAMATRIGGLPTAAQMWFKAPLAIDGIDELLRGFVPRRSSPLRSESEMSLAIVSTDLADSSGADAGTGWTVRFGPDGATTEQGVASDVDATMSGSAIALYLALWNRGSEFEVDGDSDVVQAFSNLMKVQWDG
ncbi:MAG: maleylpyruvate isomerase family mycothiol-dependent enzyme [Dermatophilus congolensis]|nr:maleylpyruvate isomerase family mycothiol-dependent enzyme [Dermatophilus congolensis]